MDHVPETYALAVPEGVVTYSVLRIYHEDIRRIGEYPAAGLLHRTGDERATPLEAEQVQRYIADFGTGRRLPGR